jgi:chromosome segregation protein
MMDVIFNGSENRNSLSFCEVSLFFDNSLKIFPIEYDEVVISRKLYRSGESEYSVNRKECRLKDILDLLRDCGIGKEGYSIIGQGRVEEVLSAKPEERRGIFEEACGISKFKARKNETERKLLRTHDNLVRLNDILSEIDRQLKPLSAQAETARIYLDLKEKLKFQEINNYICLYESVNTTKKAIEDRLRGINEEYNLKYAEYEKANKIYEDLFNSIHTTDNDINKLRNSQLSITVEIEKQAGQQKLLSERISILSEQNRNLNSEIEKNAALCDKLRQSLKEIEESKIKKQEEYEILQKESDELSSQFIDIVNKIAKGEDDAEDNQRKVIESLNRLSEIRSNSSSLIAEKNVLTQRYSEILNKIKILNADIEKNNGEISSLQSEADKIKNKKEEFKRQQLICIEKYNNALAAQKKAEKEINSINNAISSKNARLNYLKAVKENYEGYNISVKSLLSAANSDSILKSKIEGVVARLISVPPKYETAIEISLGQALQNIVTDTQENAKYLINYLKQNKLGRVTFLPMDAITERYIDKNTLNAAESCGGFIGIACDLIGYDKKYSNIIKGLLGKTIICDNLDNAVNMSRRINFAVKIVTLDGDIIHPFGSMTGGSRKNEVSNLLGCDRDITETENAIAAEKQKLQKQIDLSAQSEEEALRCNQMLSQLSDDIHKGEIDLTNLYGQLSRKQSENEQKKEELKSVCQEREKTQSRIEWINNELKTADELEAEINRQKHNADDIRAEQKGTYDVLRKQRDKLHEKTTNIKVRIASLYTEIKGSEENIRNIREQIQNIEKDINAARALIDQNTQNIEAANLSKSSINYDTVSQDELKIIKDKLENLEKYKSEINHRLSEADKKRSALSEEIRKISEKRIREENALSKADIDLDNMKDRIWEEYQITYETAVAYRAENFDFSASTGEINRLKKQINNLGYVNVNAIEDYKTLKTRYDELDFQIKDLTKAEEDLKKIISDLTNEMLARFTKGFNDINANFNKVFKELFGGGNANLLLDTTETEDPLSAGIDIQVQPPGKKLQHISLLSGGERALTAIAILFAILMLRPMPFCVLDEIEAALDDANAMRFAKYLKTFSGKTQFIVITHRKPTMELADALYGVTMQEKGVSKIVSVKLSEALTNAVTA